jgi:hypothetical protein
MSMTVDYRNAVANHGGTLITHIGLVDDGGNELAGGAPAYARKAVIWANADDGTIQPTADLTFDIPAGATVAGWRGYSAGVGGTDYGGADLDPESYVGQGEYKLRKNGTGISHAGG